MVTGFTPAGSETTTGVSLLLLFRRRAHRRRCHPRRRGSRRSRWRRRTRTRGHGGRRDPGWEGDDRPVCPVARRSVAQLAVDVIAPRVQIAVRADGVRRSLGGADGHGQPHSLGRATTTGVALEVGVKEPSPSSPLELSPPVELVVRTDGIAGIQGAVRVATTAATGERHGDDAGGQGDGGRGIGVRGRAVAELAGGVVAPGKERRDTGRGRLPRQASAWSKPIPVAPKRRAQKQPLRSWPYASVGTSHPPLSLPSGRFPCCGTFEATPAAGRCQL